MSEIIISIPTPLRNFTMGKKMVTVLGSTVEEALNNLINSFTELKVHLYTESGQLRNFVNIYKGDEDIRYLENEKTPLTNGDQLSIIPSIAGGVK